MLDLTTSRHGGPTAFLMAILLHACAARAPAPQPRPAPPAVDTMRPRVFFVVLSETIAPGDSEQVRTVAVPLACLHEGALDGGGTCLAQIPASGRLALNTGQPLSISGRGRAHCGEQQKIARVLVLDGIVDSASHAIWPPSASPLVKATVRSSCRGWCTFQRTGHPRVRVSAEQQQLLAKAVFSAGLSIRAPEPQVVQVVSIDVDSDAIVDTLFSVAVMDPEAGRYAFAFSGLFLANGRTPDQLVLLHRQDSDAIVVRGTLDLDEDGQQELWLLLSPTEGMGSGHLVLQLSQGKPRVIGRHICSLKDDDI